MRSKLICVIGIIFLAISAGVAQVPIPNALWSQIYGGPSSDFCRAIQPAPDHGFILAGETYSSSFPGNGDMILIRIDEQGRVVWYRLFGGGNAEQCNDVIITLDGGYALAGFTMSYGAGQSDMYLVKTDSLGNQQWQRTFGGAGFENCYAMGQAFDASALASGIYLCHLQADAFVASSKMVLVK